MAKSRYFQNNSMEDIKKQAQGFRNTNQAAAAKTQALTQWQVDNAVQSTLTEKATSGIYNNTARQADRRDNRIRSSVDTSSFDKQLSEKYAQLENTPVTYDLNDPTRYHLKQEIVMLEDQKEAFAKSEYERLKAEDWEKRQAASIGQTGDADLPADLQRLHDLKAELDKAAKQSMNSPSASIRVNEAQKEYSALLKELQGKYGENLDGWQSYVSRQSNKEEAAKVQANAAETAKENPFWMSAATLPVNMAGGLGFVDVAGQKAQRMLTGSDVPIDYNTPGMRPAQFTNAVRGSVSEKIEEDTAGKVGSNTALGNLYSGAYNLGMSMGDSAIGALTGSSIFMAGSTATNAMLEAKERGATDNQALLFGLSAGAMDGVMEKMSIDKLVSLDDPKTLKQFFVNGLKLGAVNAPEEVLTSVGTTLADAVIMGDKSQLNTAVNAYIQQGYTQEEAEKLALKEWGKGLLMDAIGGFITGEVFASAKGLPEYISNKPQSYTPKNVPIDNTWTPEQKADLTRWLDDWMQEGREPERTASSEDIVENKKTTASETITGSPVNGPERSNAAVGAENNIAQEASPFNDSWQKFMDKHKGQPSVSDYLAFGRQIDNEADAEAFVEFLDQQERDGLLKWRSDGAPGRVMPAEDHIDQRDYGSVGDRKVKSFQYNNPEVQPYFREGLEIFGEDLSRSLPGERYYNGLDPNGVGSQGKWSGQKRHTTPEIAMLKDDYRMSWGDIDKAYEDLLKDAGRENNANAKRLELVIDKILTEGHRTLGGVEVPPNQGYIETKSKIDGYAPNPKATSAIDDDFMRHEFGDSFDESTSTNAVGAAESGFDPYSHAANTYGAIEPGENPARVVDVPKSMDGETNVKQTVRTILEADVTTDQAVPALEREIVKGGFSAMPITDRAAADRAEATIRQVGYAQALADWRAEVRDGKVSKYSVAMGETLYNAAVSAGDTKSAVKIAVEFATQVRSAAQALQAVRMLKKMSPAAQLYGVKQSVDNLQQQLQKQYGDRAPNLVIDETLAANFLDAQTEAERTAAEEALYKDIAQQIPATFSDKWNAWRYLSMLGNPRTHIRNIIGNAAFAPVRGVKNQIGGLMEAIAQGVGIIDKSQRTKSVGFNWSKKRHALVEAAKADYTNVQDEIQSGDKYNSATDTIERNRRIFDNAVLETLRRGNSAALDVEDQWFSKGAYTSSLASYLNARGYTAEDFTGNGMTDKQKDDARAYAILEAQKATYRDLNALSELVTSAKFKNPANSKTKSGELAKRAANTVVEGVLPFKKTPANILARAMEYSPAGLAKALTVDSVQVAKGKITAAEYMDHLASGLTGTGLFALGYFLSNSGLLVGGTPEDEEQFDLEGRQPYSLEVGGKSTTLDWLAPEALPVFMGVELAEAIAEYGGEALSMETMKSVFHGITGPILEMSMMSGLQDALDAVSYADDKMSAIVANAALGYLGQAVPTLFGQIERIIGKGAGTRQTTFTQKGQFLDTDTQYALGNTLNKVPLLDFQQVPYIDAWGRTESTGGTGERASNNLINPAYMSDLQETPVDAEINRLEQATGENLTPARASKVLTVDGEKVLLTANEYVTYATAKGQNDYTFRESLLDSEDYSSLDDATKVKAMEYAKDYADVIAREETGLKADKAEWMVELDGADIGTVTQTLLEKAAASRAGSGSYENKYAGISDMLDTGTINDTLALAIMSDSAVDGYMEYCKNAGVSVAEYADVYAYMNKSDSKEDTLKYIEGLSVSKAKKVALAQGIYGANPTFIPIDSDVPKNWLLEMGATDEIVDQFSDSQKELYNTYIRNTGVDMGDYLDIWAFKNSAKSDKDANGKTTYSAQNKVIDEIDRLDVSNEVKRNLFLAMDYSAKNIPYWWK